MKARYESAPVSDGVRAVTECRVCGSDDWAEVVSFGPVPLANAYLDPADSYEGERYYPLDVVSCRACRLMSLTHVVDPEILFRSYSYVTPDSVTINRHMRRVVELCRERSALDEGELVVEIGSNTGAQLSVFGEAGTRILGVDPARNLAATANARGVPTLPEFFSSAVARDIAAEHGRAKLILGRHVFAHIDDIAEVAAGVRALLDRAGVFVIEVPYALDLIEKLAFDTIYHEHLSYFAVEPLTALFERHGLRVLDVERMPVHGGSILVFVGHASGPLPVRPAVAELLALEERSGLYDDDVYERFARDVEQVREELSAMVRGFAADGLRVAGYGAPAKGNTLLNVCGLGADELVFCSDSTELKQGKVLPGTHIPVRPPDYARANPPDCYLLLAWNYAEEILRKESAFLAGGGRFILPVPKPWLVPSAEAGAPGPAGLSAFPGSSGPR
ncbi:class I SAM-dependent methyltransferase [Actinomadura viridis]|uniref:Novobiocin biosynthesis protein NovU/D-mycarose 3-C-methyltransferase n=1 Tax=Actinomadura viridis TaxID=58110 RepID=A0A931DL33_9ACTN|nr:class I SAM-dependent methyltransferase [Actinomadura viridis]MBG6090553.1 novobiocin biosynthesis protein NovU/D-mycarose 3-C-methyltransferase [Actinomadura viridis]